VAIDFDIGSARSEPAVPIVSEAIRWIQEAFHVAGAWPRIGATLGRSLKVPDCSASRPSEFKRTSPLTIRLARDSSRESCVAWRR
jgi:hypothetical protein